MVYPDQAGEEDNAAVHEEEQINLFEAGVHPDQQQVPDNHPALEAPPYTHSVNKLAAMLHFMEIAQYSGLTNMYYDTQSLMYTEAMTYRATFPPPTFGTLYPMDPEWRRKAKEEEAATMEWELLDVEGLDLNMNVSFTDFLDSNPPEES
ncbi:hypothetical protein L195_g020763 [Trifolium pratense]|uniref:Uncharacterized protein n=1 Tax=Trifolium pratense TaxID=57577 RepID=A0A2K3N3B1_TRIPR|nr:hypothetical protein L195_g020763 [Trifolium pratense]